MARRPVFWSSADYTYAREEETGGRNPWSRTDGSGCEAGAYIVFLLKEAPGSPQSVSQKGTFFLKRIEMNPISPHSLALDKMLMLETGKATPYPALPLVL